MKKLIMVKIFFSVTLFTILFLLATFLYADRIRNNQFSTIYKNSNGSLDSASFYEDMNNIPNDYFIYIKYVHNDRPASESALIKFGPGAGMLLSSNDDIEFNAIREGAYSHLEARFSPFNYTNAATEGWVPFGIKRTAYNRFMERWNYYIDVMNDLVN